MPELRNARPEDIEEMRVLITEDNMPAIELERWLADFLVVEDDGKIVGCAGVETYGEAAVLRSVVIAPSLRGTGEGVRLVEGSLDYAREKGAKRCYLFTMTAVDFFPRFGFSRCSLDDFEPSVRASWQWRGVSEHEQLREALIPMRADL